MIRRNHQTGEVSLEPLRWGLIPYWCQDPKGGRRPINAKCETVRNLPTFRDAYRRRRCIVPVDGFASRLIRIVGGPSRVGPTPPSRRVAQLRGHVCNAPVLGMPACPRSPSFAEFSRARARPRDRATNFHARASSKGGPPVRRRPRPVSSVIWAWHANPRTPLRRGRRAQNVIALVPAHSEKQNIKREFSLKRALNQVWRRLCSEPLATSPGVFGHLGHGTQTLGRRCGADGARKTCRLCSEPLATFATLTRARRAADFLFSKIADRLARPRGC